MFLLLSILLILFFLFIYGKRNFNYWKKKGIIHDKPYPFVGNSFKQLILKVSITDFFLDIYKRYPNERFVGVYMANKPALLLRDPKDVQRVLVSDFHSFYLRGIRTYNDEPDPMNRHLFAADGDLWKLLRQRMTPAFTTGKLKAMFPLIIERAEKLQTLATDAANKNEEVDIKDLIARYTTDFIGACGFGINMDALQDKNSIFRQLGLRIFKKETNDVIRTIIKVLFPSLTRNIPTIAPEIRDMTVNLVSTIMKERNYEPSVRNDFIDLLLEVKKKGNMVGESIEKKNPDGSPIIVERELDDLLIAAQVFVFFAAGFETSSSTSSFTLHQLAFNPDKQEKCQEEIDEVLKKYDGKLCYDSLTEMKYLKMCFNEAMRIYPSVGVLLRKSATKYTFPDSDLTIDENISIIIVNQGMQMDKRFFDEPEKFIPERFSPDNASNIPNHVFLPFGEGPRACIGERLGLMQSLAGLAVILSKFSVSPSKNSKIKPINDPHSGLAQTVKGGIPLQLIARKKTN
ncbi:unnamed protein product [Diatraea saccharalis]|uniref:unspecific monooxygenase n=1 Tax=Diatraea saccharalis TaxID=40085 RepID=A0A9N9WGR7_9NEOP|nr:unnamed protein product [Diatraea saccharalis]